MQIYKGRMKKFTALMFDSLGQIFFDSEKIKHKLVSYTINTISNLQAKRL